MVTEKRRLQPHRKKSETVNKANINEKQVKCKARCIPGRKLEQNKKNGSTVLVIDTKTKEQNQKQEGLFWLLAPKRKRKLTTGVKKNESQKKTGKKNEHNSG